MQQYNCIPWGGNAEPGARLAKRATLTPAGLAAHYPESGHRLKRWFQPLEFRLLL
jgi:hypothetical protein